MPRREPDPNLENLQTSCLRTIQEQVKKIRLLSETTVLEPATAQVLIGYTKTLHLLRAAERAEESRRSLDLVGMRDDQLQEKLIDLGYSLPADDTD